MSMTTAIITLEHIECCSCHGIFGMTRQWIQDRRRDHKWWRCPYCESQQHWSGESDIARAERLAREANNQLAVERSRHDQTRATLRETERRRRAEKGAKTRLKNRVANGVCPCCNRFFANLHRHMTNQHPDFTAQEADQGA